jgi:tRNA G10  N-methylase Trm11
MEIYQRFKPNSVLDPTCGWGGRMVGAVVSKVPHYIGIDLNQNLKEPYKNMISNIPNIETVIETYIGCDAVTFDYSKLNYDMIFTSPPYFNIELYPYTNKKTKQEWIDNFYKPLFLKTFEHLLVGGWMCINISTLIYKLIFIDLFGEADEIIPMALKIRPKQSQTEFIYCWLKR